MSSGLARHGRGCDAGVMLRGRGCDAGVMLRGCNSHVCASRRGQHDCVGAGIQGGEHSWKSLRSQPDFPLRGCNDRVMIRLGMPCSELAIAWFAFHAGFIAWAWTQVNLFLPGCWALQRLRVTT